MLKTESIIIDGVTYTVTQLPAMRAMKLFTRVGRIAGPALKQLAPSFGGSVANLDMAIVGGLVGSLFEQLNDNEVEHLANEFFWNLTKNGQPCFPGKTFGIEMAGSLMTIFQLLRFAFEVNFGDFFDAARGLMAKALPMPALSSK